MKKKTVKKLKLKESIKVAITIIVLYVGFVGVLLFNSCRIEAIENNPDAWTESGHAHAVEVNFTR